MAYLYRHIRLDTNQPFYIGISFDNNNYFYHRAYEKSGRNKHWLRVVSKTDYEVEIVLDNITNEDAIKKEIEFINLYGKRSKGGMLCNIADGGNGGNLGEDVNNKISNSLKGHKVSEDAKKKIRDKAIGRIISVDTKLKMSETHKRNKTGHWLESKGHKNGNSKKVYQYTLDGHFIKEWECGRYACKELGINISSLSAALNKKQKTAGGFTWKFTK